MRGEVASAKPDIVPAHGFDEVDLLEILRVSLRFQHLPTVVFRVPGHRAAPTDDAIGGDGGYLCASQSVIDLIRTRCRTLFYSTGLPPGVVAAAIAALELIESDPDYAALPLTKAKAFTALLGLSEAESPIVPIVLGDSERTLLASRLLEDEGFLVVAIRPPTVPDGKARLRVTFTAAHKDEDIARLAEIIRTRILEARDAAARDAEARDAEASA